MSAYSARQRCRRFLYPYSSRRRARRDPRLVLWLASTCCAFQLRRLRVSIGHMLPLHAQPIRSCEPDQLQVIPLENDPFGGRPCGRPSAVFRVPQSFRKITSCCEAACVPCCALRNIFAASNVRHRAPSIIRCPLRSSSSVCFTPTLTIQLRRAWWTLRSARTGYAGCGRAGNVLGGGVGAHDGTGGRGREVCEAALYQCLTSRRCLRTPSVGVGSERPVVPAFLQG